MAEASKTPTSGGYTHTFLRPVMKRLLCEQCGLPMRAPVELPCDEHHCFCLACVQSNVAVEVKQGARAEGFLSCPKCGQKCVQAKALPQLVIRRLHDIILAEEVQCHEFGTCGWTGLLSDLPDHFNEECPGASVCCPQQQQQQLQLHNGVVDHLSDGALGLQCSWQGRRDSAARHVDQDCPLTPIPCQAALCNDLVVRATMSEHLQKPRHVALLIEELAQVRAAQEVATAKQQNASSWRWQHLFVALPVVLYMVKWVFATAK